MVAEIDGVAQICVTVRPESGEGCPVEYSFSVSIVKMDISGGLLCCWFQVETILAMKKDTDTYYKLNMCVGLNCFSSRDTQFIPFTDAEDYDNSPVTATFPRCGTEQCADVPLYYSCDMEPNETFRAILQSEGTSDNY